MSMLGNYEKDQTFTLASGESVTGFQVVMMNASPTNPDDLEVKVHSAGDLYPVGVAQYDGAAALTAGKQVTVRIWGVTKAKAAGAINPGQPVYPTATGHVAGGNPSTSRYWLGCALTKATQLGDEILVLINQGRHEA